MKTHSGFSLVELLVVLGIAGILMAVAYPSYANFIIRTRRVEGQIALVETMQQQERYFTRTNSYIAFSSGSGDEEARKFKWWSGTVASTSAYELRGRACPGKQIAECVEVQAMPGTSKVDAKFKDPDCQMLTLDSTGAHKAEGSFAHCWP
ncbi:MAG: type IV pilin protein [Pseudomonadota bacterium]